MRTLMATFVPSREIQALMAKRYDVSERTVRNYMQRVRDDVGQAETKKAKRERLELTFQTIIRAALTANKLTDAIRAGILAFAADVCRAGNRAGDCIYGVRLAWSR